MRDDFRRKLCRAAEDRARRRLATLYPDDYDTLVRHELSLSGAAAAVPIAAGFEADTPDTQAARRELLSAELRAARKGGYRVPRLGRGYHIEEPAEPYDGPRGRALADVRSVGREVA